ncbi:uncharacterized protein [Phaseolus vulgaris]|uniref:uncharacterized protein n=1 Tax=Phaseolus vulgaris TaxID=3885 RepID=UPI0035CB6C70
MEATHILLGRPWQFDRKDFHDGLTNKLSFDFHGHKVILKSLSPKEVHEDQLKMKQKRENEKDKKSSKKSLLMTSKQVNKVIVSQKSIFLAMPRTLECVTDKVHSTCLDDLVKEIHDVFQDPPKYLPPLRGIEHQIDFMPGVSSPNRPAYRTNPKEDQIKIKTKRENEKANEVHDKPSHNTFSTNSILIRATPTRYPSSLSFSLPKVPTYTLYRIKNVKADFFLPPIFPNKIIPKQYFPTYFPSFPNAKSNLPISSCILLPNCKLTLFYVGVLNSWTNSLQLGEYDANQIDVINRRNGQGSKHLKFFLLVFAKDEAQAQSPSPRRPSPSPLQSKNH